MNQRLNYFRFLEKVTLAIFILITFGPSLVAQNKGLREPQDPAVLPKSRVMIKLPTILPKLLQESKLIKSGENEWIVSSGWELAAAKPISAAGNEISGTAFNTDAWINATVPGTILTSLVNCGYYPDPLYGLNNMAIPDTLCRTDWWYRTVLPLPSGVKNKRIQLLLNGINYKADVWLNGSLLGSVAGAFIRGQFDITTLLRKEGGNVLAIHIFSHRLTREFRTKKTFRVRAQMAVYCVMMVLLLCVLKGGTGFPEYATGILVSGRMSG